VTIRPDRIPLNRLYGDLAYLWPLVDSPEDEAPEGARWRRNLRKRLGPGRHPILELGVGGGFLLSTIARGFEATAVDASEEMLAHSMKLNPDVEHHVGDMRTIRLEKTFKAVLVYDAINYMLSEKDLRATFATARAHLEPGGIALLGPDWVRETFQPPHVSFETRSDGELEVTFVEYSWDPDPNDTTFESLYLYFVRHGAELRIEEDRHVEGLFSLSEWIRLLDDEGFAAEPIKRSGEPGGVGRWMLVGTLR
jgi:methyltransferase family protein